MPKTYTKQSVKCPNIYCNYRGTSNKGIQHHFAHNRDCAVAFRKVTEELAGKLKSNQATVGKVGVSNTPLITNNQGHLKNDADYADHMDVAYYDEDCHGNNIAYDANGAEISFPDDEDVDFGNHYDDVNEDNVTMADVEDVLNDPLNNVMVPPEHENEQNVVNTAYDYMDPTHIFGNFCYLNDDVHEVKLLHLLNDQNVPHGLYQDIIEWAQEAYLDGYKFCPRRVSRGAQVKYIQKWLQMDYVNPEMVPCYLPTKDKDVYDFVPVTRFNFNTLLYSLLTDPKLVGDLNQLDVNQDDPYAKYVCPTGRLSSANSGAWYQNAYAHCVKEDNDFMAPIIFAINKAKLQQGGTMVVAQSCLPRHYFLKGYEIHPMCGGL